MSRSRALLIVALAGVALPSSASGEQIDATLKTILSGRQDPGDDEVHTVLPMYELVSIRASDVGNAWFDDLKFVIGAWGRVDPGEPRDDGAATGDVDVAYAEATALDGRIALRAGRQQVLPGAARALQMDGLDARMAIWNGLGISAYGGVPVTRRFELDRGDLVGGTRVFWRRGSRTEAGLSFVHVRDDSLVSRQDLGLDARHRLMRDVTLRGSALWSTLEARIAELELRAGWRASRTLKLAASYQRTAPDLFLPRTSVLSVFSQETRDEAGLRLHYRPVRRVRLSADGHLLSLESGDGYRGGGKLNVYFDKAMATRISGEVRVLQATDNGYVRTRLSGTHRPSRELQLGLDADLFFLSTPVNGETRSLTTLATASYRIANKWSATLVGVAGASPFAERRVEVIAKIVYGPVRSIHEVSP